MSLERKKRRELLKLSKTELIKKCKKYEVAINGSKSDMIDRIIKHENKSNPDPSDKMIEEKCKIRSNKTIKKKVSKQKTAILSRSTANFIVNGYIRMIENLISNKIVPIEIIIICFNYLITNNIFISLYRGIQCEADTLNIEISRFTDNKTWEYRQADITNLDKSMIEKHSLNYDVGFCIGTDIKLPTKINQEIQGNKSKYDMVFIVGGGSQHCNGFIIDDNRIFDTNQDAKIYNWELPSLPTAISGNCLTYNNKYGLICIGGISQESKLTSNGWKTDSVESIKSVYILPFNDDKYSKQDLRSSLFKRQWQWNKLENMKLGRSGSVATMISSRLIVFGGNSCHGHVNSVETMHLSKNKWNKLSEMNHARYKAGVYYNKDTISVFVGGGSTKYIERYDIMKNKWLDIACTQYELTHPILWMGYVNKNLLYVASKDLGQIEQVDLRMEYKTKSIIDLPYDNLIGPNFSVRLY